MAVQQYIAKCARIMNWACLLFAGAKNGLNKCEFFMMAWVAFNNTILRHEHTLYNTKYLVFCGDGKNNKKIAQISPSVLHFNTRGKGNKQGILRY